MAQTLKRIQGCPAFVADSFYPNAKVLRSEFEKNFADPLSSHSKRFVWDYWNVPDQYTLLRTPAYHYFSRKIYKSLHESLLKFGRETLGCYDITPPWLSYYVEGCRQNLHADVPHGPWAFVYSLTPWQTREFTGGETLLLKPSTLDYWKHFSILKGVEYKDLAVRVPARFNRLLIFDPRVPHGVETVHGIHDPRQARLVIHGWFTDPEPYVVGSLKRSQATSPLNEMIGHLTAVFEAHGHLHGSLSLRFKVSASGLVSRVRLLTNTLISTEGLSSAPFLKSLGRSIENIKFPKAKGSSEVTLPLVFR
jgi:hypothetical protein